MCECIKTFLIQRNNLYGLALLDRIENTIQSYLDETKHDSLEIAVIFLLTSKKDLFNNFSNPRIKQILGSCPFQTLKQIKNQIDDLKEELSTEEYKFVMSLGSIEGTEWYDPNFETVPLNKVNLEPVKEHFYLEMNSFNENEKNKFEKSFSMAYDMLETNGASAAFKEDKIDNSYLPMQYTKYHDKLPGLSCEEFCKSLMQILSSNRSDNELQNELFEMLGFEVFELISELLDNRRKIVDNVISKQSKF